jgi:hypothetical protein
MVNDIISVFPVSQIILQNHDGQDIGRDTIYHGPALEFSPDDFHT